MKLRKILGVIALLLGVGLISMSLYITSQVEEGQGKVSSAEKTVERGNDLFSLNPVTKGFGKGLSGSAQKKIDEAKSDIAQYTQYALWMKVIGIGLLILGAVALFFRKKK